MKNGAAFALLACILAYGCALAPVEQTAFDRDRAFRDFSLARAQAMNEWWGK